MLSSNVLATALTTLSGQPFQGILHRAVHLKFLLQANPQPLFSLGAPRVGARFTPLNGMPTLYLAEDYETACTEINYLFPSLQTIQATLSNPPPFPTLIWANVSLESVLDLGDMHIQRVLQTNLTELTAPWRPFQASGVLAPTQELGAAVFAEGRFQALRFPSARVPGRFCFAIFPDQLVSPAFVEVNDPQANLYQRLP